MISLFNEEGIQKAYGKEKHDEGVAVGEARGKDEKAKASAIRMHKRGMPNGVIADILGYAKNVVAGRITVAFA